MDTLSVGDIPSCTAQTLRSLVIHKLSRMIVGCAIPPSLKQYTPLLVFPGQVDSDEKQIDSQGERGCLCTNYLDRGTACDCQEVDIPPDITDDIIMAEAGMKGEDLLGAKKILVDFSQEVYRKTDLRSRGLDKEAAREIVQLGGLPSGTKANPHMIVEHCLKMMMIMSHSGFSVNHGRVARRWAWPSGHLRELARWWRDESWFGGPESKLRKTMRSVCHDQLKLLGEHFRHPLLFFTLELLLCPEAGRNLMVKVQQVIHVRCSFILCNFLTELQPFGITRLYTNHLSFSCPVIINTICGFSPRLRFLHLHVNFVAGEFLRELGWAAPNLETLIIAVREYETYDSFSSTVNIVINADEDFIDCLYYGFFDGMQRDDIKLKIENDGMKSVQLSFPQLKYVDIGSHKIVREFLHYLLHLYPGLRSISCDTEGWHFSKYSLHFPIVTPSSLGSGPPIFEDSRAPIHLQDMSFSSFCLLSRLPEIIARYQSLQHISFHLLKGPWKITSTNKMALDLVSAMPCRCLTICVDIYMSTEDLIGLYLPSLQALESSLTVLQLHLTNEVSSVAIRQIINLCLTLRELALVSSVERCEVAEHDPWEEIMPLNNLPTLKALGISSEYNVTSALYTLTSDIMDAAPNLTLLDLEFGGNQFQKWLLNNAACGRFTRIEVMRLYLVPNSHEPGRSEKKILNKQFVNRLFSPLVAAAPRLTQLMVRGACTCFVDALRVKYWGSQLQIMTRGTPIVAFRTLASKFC